MFIFLFSHTFTRSKLLPEPFTHTLNLYVMLIMKYYWNCFRLMIWRWISDNLCSSGMSYEKSLMRMQMARFRLKSLKMVLLPSLWSNPRILPCCQNLAPLCSNGFFWWVSPKCITVITFCWCNFASIVYVCVNMLVPRSVW